MHTYHPNATIFFNSGGADIYKPEFHDYQSHFEMEDLPTAWGGYDQLPLRAKYFVNTGKKTIGMTGKFHLNIVFVDYRFRGRRYYAELLLP